MTSLLEIGKTPKSVYRIFRSFHFTMSNHGRYCILLHRCLGKKREKGLLKSGTSKIEVLPGTLLIYLDVDRTSISPKTYFLETLEPENVEVHCEEDCFTEVKDEEYEYLISIPTCNERLSVFYNKEWLEEGFRLHTEDIVEVSIKGVSVDVLGVLKYKGPVGDVPGIYFGVELIDSPRLGTSDGIYRKHRYFQCEPDNGVFAPLHRIRKHKEQHKPVRKPQTEGASAPYRHYGEVKNSRLPVNTRVVWMSDHGAEHGVVKWIGVLPDSRREDDLTVGVEFDNPVGSGTGKYKDRRLFIAKQGHASLVPILGLMKEEEFFNTFSEKPDQYEEGFEVGEIEQQKKLLDAVEQNRKQEMQEKHETREPDPIQDSGSQPHPPSKANTGGQGINPLYEYSRNKSDYLDEGLEKALVYGSSSSSQRGKTLPEPDPDLEVGSLVEVMSSTPLYGLIQWIGHLPDQKEPKKLIAGLEMEEEISAGTDGTFQQHRMFHCPPRKGFFVPLYKCRKDNRFSDSKPNRFPTSLSDVNFGSTETPDLPGTVSPPDSLDDFSVVCGKGRGIQGHHNSCYMDATVLAMFYFTPVFDSILYRPRNQNDLEEYDDIQQVLKEGIVNPLRRHHYVRADKMMKLRKLLDKVGKIPGMMSEEKDPEEFLNLLLNEITKADPFLKISSGDSQETQMTYFYQLIMEKDERLVLPTTQQLFELSFLQMGIKLREIPSCLIIQMPRFGKDYKMYKRILPSLELDITDVLENAPRECIICGDLAAFECQECYQVHGAGLNTIAFCEGCKRTSHQHKLRLNHKPRQIRAPDLFKEHYRRLKSQNGQSIAIPREKMELFAVICIQTSHYVSFVKCGKGKNSRWIFFDSMADRMGEQSGYNIPEVKECGEILSWLSDDHYNEIINSPDDKFLPEHMRRLICDAYICMYQSPDVMKFK